MKKQTLLLMIGSLFILWGCTKFNAGVGGKAQINVKVIYSSINIPDAEVKVMYNARYYPGADASYNDSKTADKKGNVSFKNLRRGDYYFYGSAVVNDTLREGGVYCRIKSKIGETHVVIDFGAKDPFNSVTPPLENP